MTDGIFSLLLSAVQQNWILYSFFWVTHGRLNFICRCFGTSETSANKIQALGHYPKERIQHSQHAESLKSRKIRYVDGAPNMKLYKNPLSESGTVTNKWRDKQREIFDEFAGLSFIVAPCIVESIYCSLTNKCTFIKLGKV